MINHAKNIEDALNYTLMRAVAYSSALNFQDAINDINKVFETQPDKFIALWQRTICEAMMVEFEKSTTPREAEMRHLGVVNDFTKLLEISPNNPMVLYCYGTYNARKGDYDKAIEIFNKVIQLSPRMPYAYYNRGLSYMKKGNSIEAKRDFSKSGELGLYGAYSLLKK
jgi:tetratricopeptide (TPR) repeat protein